MTSCQYDVDDDGLDTYLGQLRKSLDELLPVAERLNYTIALENLPPGPNDGRLSSRVEHFERIEKEFKHPSLGFILDTGHALMAGGTEGADRFHAVMAPRMVAYHLADNAGDRDSHLGARSRSRELGSRLPTGGRGWLLRVHVHRNRTLRRTGGRGLPPRSLETDGRGHR